MSRFYWFLIIISLVVSDSFAQRCPNLPVDGTYKTLKVILSANKGLSSKVKCKDRTCALATKILGIYDRSFRIKIKQVGSTTPFYEVIVIGLGHLKRIKLSQYCSDSAKGGIEFLIRQRISTRNLIFNLRGNMQLIKHDNSRFLQMSFSGYTRVASRRSNFRKLISLRYHTISKRITK